MTTVSFPGLGIPEFTINPVAIPFGLNGGIRWYALLIVMGMLFAVLYCAYRAKSEGIVFDTMIDFAIFTIPSGIIGARLYYVLFDWIDIMVNNKPNPYQSFVDVIAIWNGGLAIYGGIIFGAIAVIAVAKFKKMTTKKLLKITDAVAPGVMIAQALGRWGNFCNGEAYGTQTTLPWRMGLISSNTISEFGTTEMVYVHPTFLYESLWNVIGFVIINLVYKKKRFDGQILLMYVAWYGLGRTFIELLRTDSLTNGNGIRVSSLLGLLSFIVAGSLLIYLFIKNKGKKAFSSDVIIVTEPNAEAADVATDAVADSASDLDTATDSQGDAVMDTENTENTVNTNDSEEVNDGKLD